MSKNSFLAFVGILFAFFVIVHFVRLLAGWPLQIGPWTVPNWLTLVLMVFIGYLSWTAFSLREKK